MEEKKINTGLIAVILLKGAKLLKLVKFFKLGSLLITFGSMALSMLVYSAIKNPVFGIGIVLLIFIHEMGHVWAMKIKKLPTSPPVFIPLLGAVIFAPKLGTPETEAFVGYGGPLLGGLASLVLWIWWALAPQHPPILLELSFVNAFINLFNLIPIRPLDGGRVTQIVGTWFKYIGMFIFGLLIVVSRDPSMLLIAIIMAGDFDFKPWQKFYFSVACFAIMVATMLVGLSHQSLAINIVDVTLSLFFLFIYYRRMRKHHTLKMADKVAPSAIDETPVTAVITRQTKIKWFLLYAMLVIGIFLMMREQSPQLSLIYPRK